MKKQKHPRPLQEARDLGRKSGKFKPRRTPCTKPDTGEHLILDSGGEGPVIACISHLDTVFTPQEEAQNEFHWLCEGSRIYGPVTYDIKGGTAAILMTMKAFSRHNPELFRSVRWVLMWNAAEEILAEDFVEFCLTVLPLRPAPASFLKGTTKTRKTSVS